MYNILHAAVPFIRPHQVHIRYRAVVSCPDGCVGSSYIKARDYTADVAAEGAPPLPPIVERCVL